VNDNTPELKKLQSISEIPELPKRYTKFRLDKLKFNIHLPEYPTKYQGCITNLAIKILTLLLNTNQLRA